MSWGRLLSHMLSQLLRVPQQLPGQCARRDPAGVWGHRLARAQQFHRVGLYRARGDPHIIVVAPGTSLYGVYEILTLILSGMRAIAVYWETEPSYRELEMVPL